MLLITALSVGSMVWSAFAYGKVHRTALLMMAAGLVLILAVTIARETLGGPNGTDSLWPELFGLPAFALLTWGPIRMSRDGKSGDDGRREIATAAIVDGALIMIGAASAVMALLVLPKLESPVRHAPDTWIFAFYPLADGLVVLALVYLCFLSKPGLLARKLFIAAGVAMVSADLGQVLTQNTSYGGAWVSALYVVAVALLGAAALHPSVASLGFAPNRHIQSWLGSRIAIMAVGLCTPAVLLVTNPHHGPQYRYTYAIAIVLSAALVLFRAVHAVNAYAATHASLRLQAERDPLTHLANRSAFLDRVRAMIEDADHRQRTVSVLFVDLDGFKAVNDTRGHAAGDALLISVAHRITGALRSDDFASRLGGDEFALVADDDEHGAVGERLAKRVHALFEEPFEVAGLQVHVKAAVGMANTAQTDPGGHTAAHLVGAADAAMYQAKRAGSTAWVRAGAAAHATGDAALVWAESPVRGRWRD